MALAVAVQPPAQKIQVEKFEMCVFEDLGFLGVLGDSRAFFRSARNGDLHFGQVSGHIDTLI